MLRRARRALCPARTLHRTRSAMRVVIPRSGTSAFTLARPGARSSALLIRALDEVEQIGVDRAVGSEHVGDAVAEIERTAVEVLTTSAGLRDHERAGSDVPRVCGVTLVEGVEPAGGNVGETQRRRAEG